MDNRSHNGSSSNTLVQLSSADTMTTTFAHDASRLEKKSLNSVCPSTGIRGQGGDEAAAAPPKSLPSPKQLEAGQSEKRLETNSPHSPHSVLPWKRPDGLSGWIRENVCTKALVPSLVVQALSAGVLDAVTYAEFRTFASNRESVVGQRYAMLTVETGNTILLTVSAVSTTDALLLLTGVSLASFLLGALNFGHLGHYMGVKKRYWIILSTLTQIILLAIAAILLSPAGPRITAPGGTHQWIILALFASMSGAQVAQARQSGSAELPTAPMTSSFVDLMADKYLCVGFTHPKAGPRNRRVAYLLAMIVGGFLGAVVHQYAGSWETVVLTLGLKVVVIALVGVAAADK